MTRMSYLPKIIFGTTAALLLSASFGRGAIADDAPLTTPVGVTSGPSKVFLTDQSGTTEIASNVIATAQANAPLNTSDNVLPGMTLAQANAPASAPTGGCTGPVDPYKNFACMDAYLGTGILERFF